MVHQRNNTRGKKRKEVIRLADSYLALIFFTCTMGAGSLSINLGFFQLSIFRALFIGLVCFIVLFLIISERTGHVIKISKQYGYYLLFGVIWLLYAFTSAFWVKDAGRWFITTFYIFLNLFFVFLFSIGRFNLRTLVLFLTCFVVSAILQSLLAWYEILTGDYLFLDDLERQMLYGQVHAPVVFSYNINDFGTLMLVAFFSCLMAGAYWGKKWIKTILYLASVNLALMVFFSTSRANILALFCGLLFCILIRFNKRVGVVLAVCGTVFLGSILILNSMSQTSGSDSVRINLIFDGLDFLVETAGLGIGAGQAEWWLRHRSTHAINGISNLHNWWVEILVCYGIFIFIGYLIIYFKTFFTYFRQCNKNEVFDFASMGCGLLVAFVLSSMSSSSLATCEWMWVIFPLIISIGNSARISEHHYLELKRQRNA